MRPTSGTATPRASLWAPPLLWAGFILLLTSWPSGGLPLGLSAAGVDKVGHFGLYGVLGFLVGRALPRQRVLSAVIAAALFIALFGALDEWHQVLVPGRAASVWDWVADIVGTITGLFISHRFLSRAQTRRDLTS